MEIPAVIFLLTYLIVVFILCIFAIFDIYHVFRYAFKSRTSVIVTILFLVGLLIIMGISIYFVSQIDWTQSFRLSII